MTSSGDPEERLEWLSRLKFQALACRESLLAHVGPDGRTPLLSVRVIEQTGGPQRHMSPEGVTTWEEPSLLYLARFERADGTPGDEVCMEEDDALRWAFALGWGVEQD